MKPLKWGRAKTLKQMKKTFARRCPWRTSTDFDARETRTWGDVRRSGQSQASAGMKPHLGDRGRWGGGWVGLGWQQCEEVLL